MGNTMAIMANGKAVSTERTVVDVQRLLELGVQAREQSKNVFRTNTAYGVVVYYASSGCWQHRGKVHRGTVEQFAGWITNFNRMNPLDSE